MSTKKGAKARKPSAADILIDNMEIIYWTQIEMFAHGMLLLAIQKRTREVQHDR